MMSSKITQFKKGNKGRPFGAKNKNPDLQSLNKLLNHIVEDLTENYSSLSTNNKIRILKAFCKRYEDVQVISLDGMKFEFQ